MAASLGLLRVLQPQRVTQSPPPSEGKAMPTLPPRASSRPGNRSPEDGEGSRRQSLHHGQPDNQVRARGPRKNPAWKQPLPPTGR